MIVQSSIALERVRRHCEAILGDLKAGRPACVAKLLAAQAALTRAVVDSSTLDDPRYRVTMMLFETTVKLFESRLLREAPA